MQIFIKGLDGKTVTINDVEPGTTILEVKEAFVQKVGIPDAGVIRLIYAGKEPSDESTLADSGIKSESTLHAAINLGVKPKYDPVTKFALRRRLEVLSNKKCFLFIGLGCFDNGHGEWSIRRQQCPPYVLRICQQRNLRLNIILVDPGFKSPPGTDSPQIYDIDKWIMQYELWGDKVRHFFSSEGPHKLSTYSTPIDTEEYAGSRLTLAGIDLTELADSIASSGGCFVAGNFYDESTPPHLTAGFVFDDSDLTYGKE